MRSTCSPEENRSHVKERQNANGRECRNEINTAYKETSGEDYSSATGQYAANAAATTGRRGEQLAAEWLRGQGYELCDRNWRMGRYELDVVARNRDELHFIEVKTRRADGLTLPEQALTPSKCRALMRAAALYMAQHGTSEEPRFDLVAVDMQPDGGASVRFIPDAVECHW